MTYKTLLVHLEVGVGNTALLSAAGGLARHFEGTVIGVAACQPVQAFYPDVYLSADAVEQERVEIETRLTAAESEFRAAFQGSGLPLEWRQAVTLDPLHRFVCDEARSADLVVTGATREGMFQSWTRHANNGDLVMQVGRPVVIVPAHAAGLKLERVVVGWKDMRECRHAVDAVPLLRQAELVTLVEIADDPDEALKHVTDVARWLQRHGVRTECLAPLRHGDDAHQLAEIANKRHADMIVAGAYGHSRLREWALGGVTRNLLLRAERTTFVAH